MKIKYNLLLIDAWNCSGSWEWNQWYFKEELELDENISNRALLKFLRENEYLNDKSKGKILIEDGGYNLVVKVKATDEPILALCYGEYL